MLPLQVVELRPSASVHARAQIDEAARPFDQSGEQVRGEDIDGKDLTEAVGGHDPVTFAGTDGGVVDDGVEPTRGIRSLRNADGGRDARQVADDHSGRARDRIDGVLRPLLVAGVQHDIVVAARASGRP